ncbi:MAG: response regulator transcription factor [Lysinibacillus sp.]
MKETVVIVEDDLDIMEVLSLYVENAGYRSFQATTLQEGQQLIVEHRPDVIVLDVNLPDGNGFDLAESIRKHSDAILIFLTANDTLEHKLEGFDLGADDYITKPFIPKELIARIQAHLKRHQKTNNILQCDNLLLDFDKKEVYKNGKQIPLFIKEKQLLFLLAENPNKVVSFDQLLDHVWGFDGIVDSKTLSVHISTLRRKIEDKPSQPKLIQTIRGFGYKFSV